MYNVRCMTLIRTQINLEEEQYRILQHEAERQNRSLSDLIRETINKKFVKVKRKGNAQALLNLAKHAVSFKEYNPSVPKDIVENLDDYLYGKKSKWLRLKKKSQTKKK